jgi:hypothetical protein
LNKPLPAISLISGKLPDEQVRFLQVMKDTCSVAFDLHYGGCDPEEHRGYIFENARLVNQEIIEPSYSLIERIVRCAGFITHITAWGEYHEKQAWYVCDFTAESVRPFPS